MKPLWIQRFAPVWAQERVVYKPHVSTVQGSKLLREEALCGTFPKVRSVCFEADWETGPVGNEARLLSGV